MSEKVKGLEKVRVLKNTSDRTRGFEVNTYLCVSCGTKDDYKDDEVKCHKCGHNIKETGRIKAKPIHRKQTQEIINSDLMYKCPTCGKLYDQPTVCCNQKFILTEKEKSNNKFYGRKIPGYYCTGCKQMYTEKTECCSGHELIPGDIYPDMTYEDYLKLPKLYVPLDRPDPRFTNEMRTT